MHLLPLLLEGLHSLPKKHLIFLLVHVVCTVLSRSRTGRLPAWLLPPIGCILNVGDVCVLLLC